METTLSFGSPAKAFGTATAGRVKPRPRSGPYAAFTSPAIQAGAGVVDAEVRDAVLPIVGTLTAPLGVQRVDSLVTLAVMAWLAVAIVVMAGELLL